MSSGLGLRRITGSVVDDADRSSTLCADSDGEIEPLTESPFSEPDYDEEFPLGDGRAESSTAVTCPYCGERVTLEVDAGSGSQQEYVEDCSVCCNPWNVTVRFVDGLLDASVERMDE